MVNWFPRYIPTGGVSNHHVSITTTPLPWTLGTFTLIRDCLNLDLVNTGSHDIWHQPKHAISYGQIKQHDEIDLRCYVLLVPTGVIECLIPDISKHIIYSIDMSKQWRPAHPVTAKVPARIIPVGTWLVTPPIYKPLERPFRSGPTTLSLEDLLSMLIKHVLRIQVLGWSSK